MKDDQEIQQVLDSIRSKLVKCRSSKTSGVIKFDVCLSQGMPTAVNTITQENEKIEPKRERFNV